MRKIFNTLCQPRRLSAAIGLGLILATTAAYADDDRDGNLVQVLQHDGHFTTLLAALDAAGLKDTVATGGVFTVFAPTDAAFAALPPGTVDGLLADIPALQKVLLYHVLAGRESLGELINQSTATTLEGNPVLVLRDGHKVLINGQNLHYRSLDASNGIVHPIDGVLLPPAKDIKINSLVDVLSLDGRFATLIAAVQAAGLADTLTTGGNFTVFAPTDAAFAALPPGTVNSLLADIPTLKKVLLYHVVGETESIRQLARQGSVQTLEGSDVSVTWRQGHFLINDAAVLNPDVKAPNGIIQIIGSVLLPPAPKPNLLDTLKNDGRFTTLVAALKLTGLDSVIAAGGPFTIFAPTDDAFAKVPKPMLNALLADPSALKNVLLYHVVAGDQSARDLLREFTVTTLQGQDVYVYRKFGRVFVNRSQVIQAGVEAGNGVVHVIDTVLLPQ